VARKLTKAELEKMKADFDPPHVDPGQTSLFDEDEKGARQRVHRGRETRFTKDMKRAAAIVEKRMEEPTKRAGRPKKHEETGRSVSFWLTENAIRKLRATAAARGMTAPDLLHEMIEAL